MNLSITSVIASFARKLKRKETSTKLRGEVSLLSHKTTAQSIRSWIITKLHGLLFCQRASYDRVQIVATTLNWVCLINSWDDQPVCNVILKSLFFGEIVCVTIHF